MSEYSKYPTTTPSSFFGVRIIWYYFGNKCLLIHQLSGIGIEVGIEAKKSADCSIVHTKVQKKPLNCNASDVYQGNSFKGQ